MYGFIVWIVLSLPCAALLLLGFSIGSPICALIGIIMAIVVTGFVMSCDYGD